MFEMCFNDSLNTKYVSMVSKWCLDNVYFMFKLCLDTVSIMIKIKCCFNTV